MKTLSLKKVTPRIEAIRNEKTKTPASEISEKKIDTTAADKKAKMIRMTKCRKYLVEKYPDTFDSKKPKPLAIGISEQLLQEPRPDDISKTLLRNTFALYVCSWKYKKCLQEGVERVGLDGKVTGIVTADEVRVPAKPAQSETVVVEVDG